MRRLARGVTLLALCAASSCSTPTPPSYAPLPPFRADAGPDDASATLPAARELPSGPLTLEAAIARAIENNSAIALLRAAENIAFQERRAATDLDDPEFSAAWGNSSSDGFQQDWSSQQSTTYTRGRERSSETQRDLSLVPADPSSVRRTTSEDSSRSTSRQFSSEYSSGTSDDDEDSYRIGLRFFVPNPWLMSARVSARKAEMQAARSDRLAAEWSIAIDVHRLFMEINHLTNDLALANTAVSLHDVILDTVRERAEQTGATGADILRATQSRMRAVAGRDRTRQASATAMRELANLLNMPARALHIDASSATNIPLNLALISRDEIEALAMRSREDLLALYWRMRAAQELYREVRREGIPWISQVDATYGESRQHSTSTETSTGSGTGSSSSSQSASGQGSLNTIGAGGVEFGPTELRSEQGESSESESSRRTESGTSRSADSEDSRQWQVGFMINVPIFTWFVNNADDVALAEYKLAAAQYAEMARQIAHDVQNACDELEVARREWDLFAAAEGPFLKQVRQSLESLEGTTDLTPDEVAATKVEIVNALRLWRESRLHFRQTVVALERAAGVPIEQLRRPVVAPPPPVAPAETAP